MLACEPSLTAAVTWMIIAAQILGLASAWVARSSEGSRHQTVCQRLFLAVLLLVGVSTVMALAAGSGYWISCSATLSLMVVGTTGEFSRRAMPTAP